MSFLAHPPMALLLTLAIAAPSAVRAQIEEGRVPLKTAVSELHTFRAAYADAYNTKNVAALAAMYDADATILLAKGTVVVGQEAIKHFFTQEAPKFPHLVITSDTMRVFGNTAIDQGTGTYHPAAGATIVERYLVVLRRGMKDWKILRLAAVTVSK